MIDAVMYGVMPSAKTESRRSAPPEKMSRKPEQAALLRLEELLERRGVEARRRDVRSDPVDREQPEREEDPLPEVRDREDVAERLEDLHADRTSQRPPAASIFFFAPSVNLWAETTSAFLRSPVPSTLSPWPLPLHDAGGLRGPPESRSRRPRTRARAARRVTVIHSLRKMFVKPRFGIRRWSGIWPPSCPRRCE